MKEGEENDFVRASVSWSLKAMWEKQNELQKLLHVFRNCRKFVPFGNLFVWEKATLISTFPIKRIMIIRYGLRECGRWNLKLNDYNHWVTNPKEMATKKEIRVPNTSPRPVRYANPYGMSLELMLKFRYAYSLNLDLNIGICKVWQKLLRGWHSSQNLSRHVRFCGRARKVF